MLLEERVAMQDKRFRPFVIGHLVEMLLRSVRLWVSVAIIDDL